MYQNGVYTINIVGVTESDPAIKDIYQQICLTVIARFSFNMRDPSLDTSFSHTKIKSEQSPDPSLHQLKTRLRW